SVYAVASKQATSPLGGQTVTPPKNPLQQATCFDGIQNQGETGIDCGGPCQACRQPQSEQPYTPQDEKNSYLSWIVAGFALLVLISGTVGTYVITQKPKPPELYPITQDMNEIEKY